MNTTYIHIIMTIHSGVGRYYGSAFDDLDISLQLPVSVLSYNLVYA